MKKYLLLTFACICTLMQLTAQKPLAYKKNSINRPDADARSGSSGSGTLSSGTSGTGANIDVVYHKAFWRINPDSSAKYIWGYVQTNFKTITAGVTTITMDMNAVLILDSVFYRGAKITTVTRSGNIITMPLGVTLGNNILDSIWIYYHGQPPAVSGSAEGYQRATDATSGQNYIYTLAESYEDRDWWPCKADMQDKFDSMDIIVNVPWNGPDTFWVATNGKLIDSTISGGSRTFKFHNSYPMASYLVCVSVARYDRIYRSVNVSGTPVQVVYNIFRGKSAATKQAIIDSMDKVTLFLSALSTKFGDYPYKNDKHGFYEGLGGAGGMEHQSFSAIATSDLQKPDVLGHELMHQWFGDKATCATWADLWLAEGFARYAEGMIGELVPSTGINPLTARNAVKTSARSILSTPTRITSYANSNQVWSGNNVKAVYDRGCMVVSMLRSLAGDAIFFQACKNYLNSGNGYKSATSDSLRNNFTALLGFDMTPFFNDWVVGVGHPTTVVNWNNPTGTKLVLSIASQSKSAGATAPYFHNCVVVRVTGASLPANDTLITFYDETTTGTLRKAGNGIGPNMTGGLAYTLSFVPTAVTFDPYFMTMSAGSTAPVATLDLKIVDFNAKNSGTYNEVFLSLDDNTINSDIILEKSSDAVTFSTAANMVLQTGGATKNYYFRDSDPMRVTYYRAKYKNLAGEFIYSKIVKVVTGNRGNFSILNNPASGQLNVKATTTSAKPYIFEIFNADGKMVWAEEKTVQNSVITIGISKLAKGTYMLKVSNGNEEETLKFVAL